jgi:hypothetical protein
MESHTGRKHEKDAEGLDSFVYCPYSPGILISFPEEASSQAKKKDRRAGTDRRHGCKLAHDRRTIQVPVCPRVETPQCPYQRYPLLRRDPSMLLSLCHSKSVVKYLKKR